LNIQHFMKQHRSTWSQLEQILPLFAQSPRKIPAQQIDLLTQLYKKTSNHLAHMRTNHPEDEVTHYLNQLVSQAHHAVFQEQYKSKHQLGHFFKIYFPILLLDRQRFILFAFVLFLIGALSGFIAIIIDPSHLYTVIPKSIAGQIDPNKIGPGGVDIPNASISAAIMTNNIKVAVLAFVGGITFGIATAYFMVFNGLLIGALAAVYWQAGKSYEFWAYILPHGVIELMAIFIAGGAGLYLGYRMFVPGQHPWRLQLIRTAKESVQLLMGTIPLFVIAGTIEGFITPSSLSLATKYAVAGGTLVLLAVYYMYGRVRQQRHNASLALMSK
jgi:uncharacterized membrane protein SpoIIM required for sporulation